MLGFWEGDRQDAVHEERVECGMGGVRDRLTLGRGRAGKLEDKIQHGARVDRKEVKMKRHESQMQ